MRVKLISNYDYDGLRQAVVQHEKDINDFCEKHDIISIEFAIYKDENNIKSAIIYKVEKDG